MKRENAAGVSALWTRRLFLRNTGGLALASAPLPSFHATAAAAAAGARSRYRTVSWWLTFDDLAWPNPDLHDAIRRRADRCAASAVNCCLIFGAHFRWDFLPLWERLHDLLRTIATELHERKILLFDHHSSVLTHRPHNAAEALNIARRNRHHVPFYPSRAEAAKWEFADSRLNDWRMLDVETGEPAYLPAYEAEQFCMNHPVFRTAYARYVRRLIAETGIDGLMSDDGIFYAGWRACSCPHCRERFRREHGRELPPTTDTGFWGNRQSEAFRDWIEMRFRASGDFLTALRATLPAGFPLLTCCSSSDGPALPGFGMSYQDFIRSCDHVLLEMVGSTPSLDGTWDNRIASQLLHLGIAEQHRVPCFGLGYGFFPDTAFFTWALNKFLGSDCWFSTLKGRLGAPAAQLAPLADDAELVGEGFRWERDRPHLFTGEVDSEVAVLFSRATRDYYGQIPGDYTNDYQATCLQLMRERVTYRVVTEVPPCDRIRRLVVSSAVCLSADERRALAAFLRAGGTIIATGPCGFCDERAHPSAEPWLRELGLAVAWDDPPRTGGFPPYRHFSNPTPLAQARVSGDSLQKTVDGWHELGLGSGRLRWRPERAAARPLVPGASPWLQPSATGGIVLRGAPRDWHARQFRDGSRRLIHFLPSKIGTTLHATLQDQMARHGVIEKLRFAPLEGSMRVAGTAALARVTLHSPDLDAPRSAERTADGEWSLALAGLRRYFVVECTA